MKDHSFVQEITFSSQTRPGGVMYCRFCGQALIESGTDENGRPINPRLEREQRAHSSCLKKYLEKNLPKPDVDQAPISDELIQQYARKTETQQP